MIGGCFLSASHVFKADVYTKNRTVSDNTGDISYKWQLWKTVDCLVTPFPSNSMRTQGTTEVFGAKYMDENFLQMYTNENVGRNVQITNIRQRNGTVVYFEAELRGTPPTWYNSNGSSPLLDAFGRVIEWNTFIHRAESQGELV